MLKNKNPYFKITPRDLPLMSIAEDLVSFLQKEKQIVLETIEPKKKPTISAKALYKFVMCIDEDDYDRM